MFLYADLPMSLQQKINGELVLFAVKTKTRVNPVGLANIIFAAFWLGITLIMGAGFFIPLLRNGSVNIKINGQPQVATLENWQSLAFPAVMIGGFFLIGLVILWKGIGYFVQKESYFIGTPSRIVLEFDGKTSDFAWQDFSKVIFNRNTKNIKLFFNPEKEGLRNKNKSQFSKQAALLLINHPPNAQKIYDVIKEQIEKNMPDKKSGN